HTRWPRDWSSDVCSSDLDGLLDATHRGANAGPAAVGTPRRTMPRQSWRSRTDDAGEPAAEGGYRGGRRGTGTSAPVGVGVPAAGSEERRVGGGGGGGWGR